MCITKGSRLPKTSHFLFLLATNGQRDRRRRQGLPRLPKREDPSPCSVATRGDTHSSLTVCTHTRGSSWAATSVLWLQLPFYQCWGSMTFWCGSMPLTNGSGSGFGSGCRSGSFYFHHWPSRCQLKTNFFSSFPTYYFLKVLLHHFSKIKSQKEVTKQ